MDARQTVRAFAPGSVSNVGPGFDVFGFAVDGVGDTVEARRRQQPGVVLTDITGDGGRLPREAERNTAGIAALQLLQAAREQGRLDAGAFEKVGLELVLHKGMPLASGLGSSAASAVAAVVAVDALLGTGLPQETLLRCAVEGERVACGSAHADNAAPSLYGGFVLVRGAGVGNTGGHRVTQLPVPEGLTCALLHPHVEVETRAAREALGDRVSLAAAVHQWGNAAALVAALFRGDLDLLAETLVDCVAEPVRSRFVPGFAAVRQAALDAGALGCGLSGSGPTIFALTDRPAAPLAEAMRQALASETGIDGDVFATPVDAPGARILDSDSAGA